MNEKIAYNWRYISIAVVFTLFGLAIIAQMARIQLTVNSSELPVAILLGQWEKAASRRGLILDRNGHVLAGNQTVYTVDVNFEDFNQPGEIEEVIRQHSRVKDAAVIIREDDTGNKLSLIHI